MMGLAIALGAAADAAGLLALPRTVRTAAAGAFVGLLLTASVMLVGVQAALRARSQADDAQAEQVRTLLPDPLPGSVFIPLRLSDNNTKTGSPSFDSFFSGALERSWSSEKYLRRAYRRGDFAVACWDRNEGRTAVLGAEERGLRFDAYAPGLRGRFPASFPIDDSGAKLIPWARAIPFLVDDAGRVRLISAVVLVDAQDRRTVFPIIQNARAPGATGMDGLCAVYRDGADPNRFEVQPFPQPQPTPASIP